MGWDVGLAAGVCDELKNGPAIVAAIGDEGLCRRQSSEKVRRRGFVGCLAGGEQKPHRQPVLIHHGMDLGAQSATRTAKGVIRTPFLPPAAC